MRIVKRKVSSPGHTSREPEVDLPIRAPNTLAEALELCEGDEALAVEIFTQRWVVRIQDDILRPEFVEGATRDQLIALAQNPDLTQFRVRGSAKAKGPRVLKVPEQDTYSREDMVKYAAKMGRVIQFSDEVR